ncbi:small nuclear RNA activating complex, polypeptide 3 [Tyrophagus putrescentiae]|nr:small nuclear RNA activating complex, polypeptide 3 [Tyrophagus putrescentiae]
MNHLKEVSVFPFVNPRQVSVREFIQHWSSALHDEVQWTVANSSRQNELQDAQDLNIPIETVKSLQKEINPNHFCSSIEEDKLDAVNSISSLNLETLKNLNEHNERMLMSILRDAFVCISDILSNTDLSENPDEPLPSFTKHEKMGFFFINNVFYYDARCENATYSKEIIKWAAERNIGRFTEASMEQSKFEDLTFHLGLPYLYMHANNCEHLLTFTDIQFLASTEKLACGYPKYTAVESIQKVKCEMCFLSFSKWIVLNNRRLPGTLFYFCHSCFKFFNYDKEGQKRGSFQAYPIVFNLER